jgi:membrane protein implicated in regulation of membrane protease activity
MWQIWLIIAGVCLIIEIITVGFLVFWFALGALFAMIVSLFTNSLIVQTSVFIISSTILIFATKPLVRKFVTNKNTIQTNVYSTIGKTGIVTKDIDSINSIRSSKDKWRNLVCHWS